MFTCYCNQSFAQAFFNTCLESTDPSFTNETTLCGLHPSFDADRHISTTIKSSELGVQVWPWYQSYFFNKDILITGTLIIDNQAAFYGCNIKFDNGGKILVTSGHIWAKYSDFFSCDEMWPGINFNTTSSGNRGDFYQCRIEDAQYALLPSAKTSLILIGTKFNRNHVGIRNGGSQVNLHTFSWNIFDCSSELNEPFSGQTPSPGSLSFAGIELINCATTLGGPQANNTFRNMRHGIHATNTVFSISKTKFNSMQSISPIFPTGFGIYGRESNITVNRDNEFFQNYNAGIYGSASTLSVKNNLFDKNAFGVSSELYSIAQSNFIESNRFIENHQSAIRIQRAGASSGLHNTIFDSHITGDDGTGAYAQIQITSNGVNEDLMEVSLNNISFDGKQDPRGIDIGTLSSDNFAVIGNTILITDDEYQSGGYGIRLFNFLDANGCYIFQNTVRGDGSDSDENSSAINVHGRNVNVCANDVIGLSHGLYFESTCDNSLIGQNHIDSSFVGLKATGALSEQYRRANTWATEENAFGLYAAQHTDPDLAEMSVFTLHSASAQYAPDPYTPVGWFDSDHGPANACASTIAPIVFTSFDSAIAIDDLFNSAARTWSERRVLLYKLLMHPELRTDAGAFYVDGLDSVYGQFAIVDTLIRSSILSFRNEEYLIDSLSLSITEMIEHISDIDSIQEDMSVYGDSLGLISDSLAYVKFTLLDSISRVYSEVLTARETVTSGQRDALLDVLEFNDEITTFETWHDAQMIVNRYRIKTLLNETISENGLDSLRIIAGSCLEEVGTAARLAITLLPDCEWNEYPDPAEVLCPGEGEKRHYENIDQDLKVTFFPVPASEYVTVSFTSDFSGLLELFTVDGVCIYRNLLMDQTSFTIPTSQIQNGIYSWRLISDNNKLRSGSVVIAR